MAMLIKRMENFDKEFRKECVSFFKELQVKRPKGITLELSSDPQDDGNPESDYLLNSKGMKGRLDDKYTSIRKCIYDPALPHEMLSEMLLSAQQHIDEYGIKIDWKKVSPVYVQ